MDTETTPTAASDTDQTGAGAPGTGASTSGGNGNTDDAAAAERLRAEVQSLQSSRDRLQAHLKDLETKKTTLTAAEGTPPAEEKPLTAADIQSIIRAEREMATILPVVKDEFKLADPSIFHQSFDSAEDLRAAAERSHNAIKAQVDQHSADAIKAAVESAVAPYVEKYGALAATPSTSDNGGNSTGLPTTEQVRAMSQSELDAAVRTHGEDVINRIAYGLSPS